MAVSTPRTPAFSGGLEGLLGSFRTKNVGEREAAAKSFKFVLARRQRELSSTAFASELDGVVGKLSNLAGSAIAEDCFAAIAGSECIAPYALSNVALAFKMVTLLIKTFASGNVEAADYAARVYVKVVGQEGIDLAAHVDTVISSVMESLQGTRNEFRILAGCSMVRELAANIPDLLLDRLKSILDGLLSVTKDQSIAVRTAASQAIAPCLTLASEIEYAEEVFTSVQHQVQEALTVDSMESVHGALLCMRHLILQGGPRLMKTDYRELAGSVFAQKNRTDLPIREALVALLPVLAAFDPAAFTAHFLASAMGWLIEFMEVARQADLAMCASLFVSCIAKGSTARTGMRGIGSVALSVSDAILPYIDPIVRRLEETLIACHRDAADSSVLEASLFDTIGMLANAVGPQLAPSIHRLLEHMLPCGLSASLVGALAEIAAHLPLLKPKIQDRVLSILSHVLTGHDFEPPGISLEDAFEWPQSSAPPPAARSQPRGPRSPLSPVAGGRPRSPMPPSPLRKSFPSPPARAGRHEQQADKTCDIVLALDTIGSFDFDGKVLAFFVATDVLPFVSDPTPEIRVAAVVACCNTIGKEIPAPPCPRDLACIIQQTLKAALKLIVTDADPAICEIALNAISPAFDAHIARPDMVAAIAIAFNDAAFIVRLPAARLLGRCAIANPGVALPALRRALLCGIKELEYSNNARHRMESAKLLSNLLPSAGPSARPMVKPLLTIILDRARDLDDAVACSLIMALDELNKVAGDALYLNTDDILNLLIAALSDRVAAAKRLAALKALASLATNAGIVVPFAERQSLLPILLDIILTEPSAEIRTETMRVIGFLGALDPYSDLARKLLADQQTEEEELPRNEATEAVLAAGPQDEGFFLHFTMLQLLKILRDDSLTSQYAPALESAMTIVRTLRIRCAPFWPDLLPALLNAMRLRTAPDEWFTAMLSSLISIMGEHVGTHVAPILTHIVEAWTWSPSLRPLLVEVIEALAIALGGRFRTYLSDLLPLILRSFEQTWPFEEETLSVTLRLRVLRCLKQLGAVLDDHLMLFLPVVTQTFETADMPVHVRTAALNTVEALAGQLDFRAHAGMLVHALTRMLEAGPAELRGLCMNVLYAVARNIDEIYEPFVDMVEEARQGSGIEHSAHQELAHCMRLGEKLPPHYSRHEQPRVVSVDANPAADAGVTRQVTNFGAIKLALETREWAKADEWKSWLKRLSHTLLRRSPVFPLRACASMAESYNPLAKELFGPAFMSLFVEVSPLEQGELVKAIEAVFVSATAPSEVRAALLNMIEYLERFDRVFAISVKDLGRFAMQCHAYAKALHYKELECQVEPSFQALEDLVEINHALEQQDVAGGILSMAQQAFNVQPKEEWYERLERWDTALSQYDRRVEEGTADSHVELGRMRCLFALAQWEPLSTAARNAWPRAGEQMRREIAPLAAAAAWGKGALPDLQLYLPALQAVPMDHAWYSAVLAVHEDKHTQAYKHLTVVRELLESDLTTRLGESYIRAYRDVHRTQMLAELEEAIEYKASKLGLEDDPDRRRIIEHNWSKRLQCITRDVELWRRSINIHLLVKTPRELSETMIRFADLARRNGRLYSAASVLHLLLASEPAEDGTTVMRGTPPAIYSRIKLMFAVGEKEEALSHLRDLSVDLSTDLNLPIDLERANSVRASVLRAEPEKAQLLARIYRKISHWQGLLSSGVVTAEEQHEVARHYLFASRLRPDWHKPYHQLAMLHDDQANAYLRHAAQLPPTAHEKVIKDHVVPAVKAFYRSLALSPDISALVLQDTLRLLSLLFSFGMHDEVSAVIQEGLSGVRVDVWLRVIPQLQARLFTSPSPIRRLITQILGQVGRAHPQALIYPMAVASQYPNRAKRRAATMLLDRLRDHSPKIVEQGLLIGRELVRVAILWHEMWHEGLEDASRLYYNDRDVIAMFERLEPLHAQMMQVGPQTMREVAFEQSFGPDLKEAYDLGRQYRQTHNAEYLSRAWELYYAVFRRINSTLQNQGNASIDLLYASPKLLEIRDTQLSVPGTYLPGKEPIRIASFARLLEVLSSKQHPRKLKIYGDNGTEYLFLLKGHEDIRQDERVMQLFNLVNSLLVKNRDTAKRRLNIQTFSVVPLSTNSGLIGWISNTDTLHMLIREYRQKRGVLFDLELKLMLQTSPTKYEKLCRIQQLEVFTFAMERTSGQDLYRILWLKAPSSETWLERRTIYTRSLAVMSMVGYILGLGDRHPSNLLFNRTTGQTLHVDFGDSFETAITRERYPETVPFRLTRMLVQAMEVSGVDGTFRTVCEKTMRVLRDNRESLLALLAAFVYDPLINWRLLQHDTRQRMPPASPVIAQHAHHDGDSPSHFALDERAVEVIDKVQLKLQGRDFGDDQLDIHKQVDALIKQARDPENLARLYLGWVTFCKVRQIVVFEFHCEDAFHRSTQRLAVDKSAIAPEAISRAALSNT